MIIVAGESLIDMLSVKQGGKNLFLPVPGGSPYNVAMALGRMGSPVQFLCRLSHDPFGVMLANTLEKSRVDLSLCPRTPSLSTLGFVLFDSAHKNPSYVFYTENTAGCSLRVEDIPQRLPNNVKALHFGSFSLAAEPIGSALQALLRFKSSRRLISVDPNIRPFLIHNRKAFEQRLRHFLTSADLIKLSDEDLAWMHPGLTAKACCAKYLKLGAKLVVVTRGQKGAIAMNARGSVEVPAKAVRVADTIGAGDTFQAALLTWLLREYDLKIDALSLLSSDKMSELLSFAANAAAITCTRPGCDPPWHTNAA